MGDHTRRLIFTTALALGIGAALSVQACTSGGSGAGVDASTAGACTSAADCPTYVCTCTDGTSIQGGGCAVGSCVDSTSACAGCGSHGGTGNVVTVPPANGDGGQGSDDGGQGGDGTGGGTSGAVVCHQPVSVQCAIANAGGGTSCSGNAVACGFEGCAGQGEMCCPAGTVCVEGCGSRAACPHVNCPSGAPYRSAVCAPVNSNVCVASPDKACLEHDGGRFACNADATECVPAFRNAPSDGGTGVVTACLPETPSAGCCGQVVLGPDGGPVIVDDAGGWALADAGIPACSTVLGP